MTDAEHAAAIRAAAKALNDAIDAAALAGISTNFAVGVWTNPVSKSHVFGFRIKRPGDLHAMTGEEKL